MLSRRFILAAGAVAAMVFMLHASSASARWNAEPIPAPNPAPSAAAPECCPKPCITYHHHGPKLCCDCTKPPVETTLKVKPPCSECEIDVVVCVPGCCTGEPTVCKGIGFWGRPIIEYEWCCGYRVRIAFKHCGDVLVTTWGR